VKAVLYARVSSKEQEQGGFSIPSQQKLLRNYAKNKSLEVVQEFTDAETAKVAGRTQFGKMVEFLKASTDVRIVLVEKTDRLYRNFKDYVLLEDLDLEAHFVKENEVLSKDSRSHAKFIHGIKVLMAKNYVDNLSEEVKKGLAEKAAQGKWPHRAPVGYRNKHQENKTHIIEPDPEKARFIKWIFEQYANGGASLRKLAETAKRSGLFSKNSTVTSKNGIHRILKNPIYFGEFIYKGKRCWGTHEPIVSKALFDLVQDIFDRNNHPQETKRRLPFAGLIKCGICGCTLTPEIKKGKYVYYHCTQFKGKCPNHWVREEKLAELLGEIVRAITVDEETAELIRISLLEVQKDKVNYHQEVIQKLQRRYANIQKMQDKAYEDRLSERITETYWQRRSEEWEDELVSIRSELSAHENANLNYYQTGVEIIELAKIAHSMYLSQSRQEQRRLLNTLLSNCTYDRGTLCPTYNKPFDILAKGAVFQSMRG